jgi:hypothetical protein
MQLAVQQRAVKSPPCGREAGHQLHVDVDKEAPIKVVTALRVDNLSTSDLFYKHRDLHMFSLVGIQSIAKRSGYLITDCIPETFNVVFRQCFANFSERELRTLKEFIQSKSWWWPYSFQL